MCIFISSRGGDEVIYVVNRSDEVEITTRNGWILFRFNNTIQEENVTDNMRQVLHEIIGFIPLQDEEDDIE